MRAGLKAAVVVLPFLVVFLLIRSCGQGEAERWHDRIREHDPEAVLGIVEDDLVVIAPSPAEAAAAAATVRGFRRALAEEYGDLVGRPREHRMVVVQFSDGDRLRAFAGGRMVHDPEKAEVLHGYTDATAGAIFLPPEIEPRTLRHEAVHWTVGTAHRGTAPYSPWVSEGLAQLFEVFEPDARPPVPPGIGWEDRMIMGERFPDDRLDVERLLGLEDYNDFVLEDGARNYLEALVLIAFLFEERPRENLVAYLRTEREATVGRRTAFHTIYRNREEPFVSDLRAFIARTKR
ncbi:MAG: DUF1570 domain-containing protein [Planctomycetota bacterium]|jgi:hypothetical protein